MDRTRIIIMDDKAKHQMPPVEQFQFKGVKEELESLNKGQKWINEFLPMRKWDLKNTDDKIR